MDVEMQSLNGSMNTYPRQRRRPRRTLSMNVRKLQEALTAMLNESDREQFVLALNDYHKRRNVYDFVQVLKRVIDTPVKRQLVTMLKRVIPMSDQQEFDQYTESLTYNIQPRPSSARRRARTMPSRGMSPFNNTLNTNAGDGANTTFSDMNSFQNNQEGEVKVIVLKLPNGSGEGWGFSIRGGAEHGIGIYVSMVDEESIAFRHGVTVGDLIISANQYMFERISHDEAAMIIKSARKLELVVRHVGRVPGSFIAHQTYSWVDPEGRSVSPPPEVDATGRYEVQGRSKSGLMLLKDSDERKVNCVVTDGQSLGLMIRGGTEFGLGVYITGVDAYSVAENAGLKVGDQLMDVNGQSFLDISHAEAVKVLKSSRHMMMTIKDVGRLPHARTTFDTTEWVNSNSLPRTHTSTSNTNIGKSNTLPTSYGSLDRLRAGHAPSSVFSRGAGSQLMLRTMSSQPMSMIEEQSRQLLNDNERGTMNYYISEYQNGHVSIDALVLALFELLNTHAKFSMLNEVRGVISPKDLDRFDTLVLKREVEAMKARRQEQFQHDRLSQHSLESSVSSTYTTSSVRESDDGHVMPMPLRVPEKLPPNVKVLKENMESLKIAIDQINDDSEGLPDYLSHSEKHWKINPAPSTHVIVAQVHSDFQSSGSSSPKDMEEGARSPSDSGVEVNGHYGTNGSRSSYGRSLPKQQPIQIRTVTSRSRSPNSQSKSPNGRSKSPNRLSKSPNGQSKSPNGQSRSLNGQSRSPNGQSMPSHARPSHTANKYSRHASMDNQLAPVEQPIRQIDRHEKHNGRHSKSTSYTKEAMPENVKYYMVTPSNIREASEDATNGRNSTENAQSYIQDPSQDYPGEEFENYHDEQYSPGSDMVTISPQRPVTINDHIHAPPLRRQGSIDSIHTESSTHSTGNSAKHSSDRHNKRYYSDPMHQVPKEQQKSVDNKKKSSEKLYELKNEHPPTEIGEPEGEVIIVYKHKPTLGIAIEGGANTRQPLPRIINIQPGGSAHESGGLRVGHVILEIDGHSMSGLEHKQAARLIAESFKSKRTAQMEFVVCEDNEISL